MGARTVTLLLTDVEGSTRLWERHPDVMRAVVARHDELVDEVVGAHGGDVVRGRAEGDSAFATFASPGRAVAAALGLQQALRAERWPAAVDIRSRAALHTGRVEGLYGPVVDRCTRLRGLGHGGQVLLSWATAALAESELPEGASLVDLGEHRLPDLAHPEHVFQLAHPELDREFPPLKSADAVRTNLGPPGEAPIGREAELRAIARTVDHAPVTTLTGPGGIGKSRLAVAAAHEELPRRPDGVWFADLSAADDETAPAVLAQVVGARIQPGVPVAEAIAAKLAGSAPLLVVDGSDSAASAVTSLVSAVASAAPSARWLVTSREPLAVAGEVAVPIGPLATSPEPSARSDAASRAPGATLAPSVELVLRRAGIEDPSSADPDELAAAADLAAQLEGIPLALETAAARARELGLRSTAERFGAGAAALAPDGGGAVQSALAWSHDLLDAEEQRLFRRLAWFTGGFTLEGVEDVAAWDEEARADVLDLLAGLVERALVVAEERFGAARYRLLASVRDHADARLGAGEERHDVQARHVRHHVSRLLAFAGDGGDAAAQADVVDADLDDLRGALRWEAEGKDAGQQVVLANALAPHWARRGLWSEGRRMLLETARRVYVPSAAVAQSHIAAGTLSELLGDLATAAADHAAALAILGEIEAAHARGVHLGGPDERIEHARRTAAWLQLRLGELARLRGDLDEAAARFAESRATCEALGDRAGAAGAAVNSAIVAFTLGRRAEAEAAFDEAAATYRDVGDQWALAQVLNNLGVLRSERGDHDAAAAAYDESLSLRRRLGDRAGVAECLGNLAELARDRGDRAARSLAEEALELNREVGSRGGEASSLRVLSELALADGDAPTAARLAREALAMHEELGDVREASSDRIAVGRALDALGDSPASASTLRRAVADLDAIGDPVLAADARAALAAALLDHPDEAGDPAALVAEALGATVEAVAPAVTERIVAVAHRCLRAAAAEPDGDPALGPLAQVRELLHRRGAL